MLSALAGRSGLADACGLGGFSRSSVGRPVGSIDTESGWFSERREGSGRTNSRPSPGLSFEARLIPISPLDYRLFAAEFQRRIPLLRRITARSPSKSVTICRSLLRSCAWAAADWVEPANVSGGTSLSKLRLDPLRRPDWRATFEQFAARCARNRDASAMIACLVATPLRLERDKSCHGVGKHLLVERGDVANATDLCSQPDRMVSTANKRNTAGEPVRRPFRSAFA